MKSRNLAKIVTLILSCALLIGAVVGISALAEENPTTVTIKGANIAYEGAVQVVYVVDAQNLKEGEKAVLVLLDNPTDVVEAEKALPEGAYVKTHNVDYTIGEATYKAFFSDGIAPKNLRKDIYAAAAVLDAEGNVVAATKTYTYSPYTYAMNRFNKSPSVAQTELYKALLNYGAAVQGVLDDTLDPNATGVWADEYYIVTVNGAVANMRGNLIDTYEDYTAAAPAEGKELEGWTVNGEHVMAWDTLKISQIKPGTSVIETVYGDKNGAKETFSTADDKSFFIHGADNVTVADGVATINTTKYSAINLKQQGNPLATAPGSKHVFETDMKVSGFISDRDDNNLAFIGFQTTTTGANEQTTLQGQGQEEEITFHKGVGDHFYIAGTKIACEQWINLRYEITVATEAGAGDLLEIYVNNVRIYSAHGYTKDDAVIPYETAGMPVVGFNFTPRTFASDSTLAITLDNTYCFSTGGEMTFEANLDANGGTVAPTTVTGGKAYELPTPTITNGAIFLGWYKWGDKNQTIIPQTGDSWTFGTIGKLVAKWTTPVTVTFDANGGTVSEMPKPLNPGYAYELPVPTNNGVYFGGWYDAEGNKYALSGDAWTTETEITLIAKWYGTVTGNFNDFTDDKINNGVVVGSTISNGVLIPSSSKTYENFYFSPGTAGTLYGPYAAGTKYVFEADFTYVGGGNPNATQDNRNIAFAGFTNLETTKYDNTKMRYFDYLVAGTTASEGGTDSAFVSMYGQRYQKGQTYKIRYEYTVGSGKFSIYTDGVYVGDVTVYNGGATDDTNISAFAFYVRKSISITFDNVYCGVESDSLTDLNYTLNANTGSLPNGVTEENTFTKGQAYTLPIPTPAEGYVFAGWYNGDTLVPTTGAHWLYEDGITLVAKWAEISDVTLDATYGKLPADSWTEKTIAPNEYYELPIPTIDGLAFRGWYNGDTLVANSGNWAIEGDVTLTAQWFDVRTTTYSDKLIVTGTTFVLGEKTADDSADAAGTTYVFSTDYTHHGLTSFTVTEGVVARQGKDSTNYGFIKFTNNDSKSTDNFRVGYSELKATGNWVNKDGKVVVDENKKLLDEFKNLTAEEIFYENLTWGGYTFKIGKTYHIEIVITMNGADATKATAISFITDSDNNTTTVASPLLLNENGGKTLNKLSIEKRGASSAGVTSFSFTHSFTNTTFDRRLEPTLANVTFDANGGILPEADQIINNAAYELPIPNGGAYAFEGWYNGDALIPNSGIWTYGDVTLVAKYVDVTLDKTYADQTVTSSKWSTGINWAIGSATSAADESGTVYVLNMKYTYKGLTNFNLGDDGAVTVQADQNYGFPRLYDSDGAKEFIAFDGTVKPSGKYVNAEGKQVVTDGVLTDDTITDATQIFHENLVWWGLTFKINETYDVAIKATITKGDKTAVVVTATDSQGNVQTAKPTASGTAKHTNITKFVLETRSANSGTNYSLTQSFESVNFIRTIPLAGPISVSAAANATGKTDPKWQNPNYTAEGVDTTGSVFAVTADYTYSGISMFAIDPETFAVTSLYNSKENIALIGFYNGDSVNNRIKYGGMKVASNAKYVDAEGNVVVDENGVLTAKYQELYTAGEFTDDDIFYSAVTWGGITFELGVTYKVTAAYTQGTVTVTDGVVEATAGTVKITATAPDGTVKIGEFADGPAGTALKYNVRGFTFYFRGASNFINGYVENDPVYGSYIANQSFTNVVVTVCIPDAE